MGTLTIRKPKPSVIKKGQFSQLTAEWWKAIKSKVNQMKEAEAEPEEIKQTVD